MKQAGSLISLLCVSWLTCSTALAHKRTQTGVNASSAVAGQQTWSPQVHAYIRYLEDLEKSKLSLIQIPITADTSDVAVPQRAGFGTVFFIVLSDSIYYQNRLKWISQTWGQDVPANQYMAIGDAPVGAASVGMKVQHTQCPAHTHDGACCKMGEALINAQSVLKSRPWLKWAYIVDDDAYVRPDAMEERLAGMDPLGTNKRGAIIGVTGCATPKCRGFCGGGGAAISRQALQTLVGDSPGAFLKKHMQTCSFCTAAVSGSMWGDVSAGQQAIENGISITNLATAHPGSGLYAWAMPKQRFDEALLGDPLMFHYQNSEAQFVFLHQLFSPSGHDLKRGTNDYKAAVDGLDLLAQDTEDKGLKSSEDECVNFKGNTQCWSQPALEKMGAYFADPNVPPWSIPPVGPLSALQQRAPVDSDLLPVGLGIA